MRLADHHKNYHSLAAFLAVVGSSCHSSSDFVVDLDWAGFVHIHSGYIAGPAADLNMVHIALGAVVDIVDYYSPDTDCQPTVAAD